MGDGRYRPTFVLEDGEHHSGMIKFGEGIIEPGENGEAIIIPLVLEHWEDVIVGDVVNVHEGTKVVATAEIIERI